MSFAKTLSRDEMKNVMAGSSGGQCWVECCGCNNDTCKGWVDDCDKGVYEICGPGEHDSDPCATCVCSTPE